MYGSATSFLLIFCVKNDLVKVSCKSDAQKCQNPYFDQVSESTQPLLQIYPPLLQYWGDVLGLPRWFGILFFYQCMPGDVRACQDGLEHFFPRLPI